MTLCVQLHTASAESCAWFELSSRWWHFLGQCRSLGQCWQNCSSHKCTANEWWVKILERVNGFSCPEIDGVVKRTSTFISSPGMIDFISMLPTDVMCGKVFKFLSWKDTVQLDSVAASTAHRRLLLEEIYPRCEPLTLPRGSTCLRPAWIWCILRGARLSCFTFSPQTEDMIETLSLNRQLVDEIELRCVGQNGYCRLLRILISHSLEGPVRELILIIKHQHGEESWTPVQDEARLWSSLRSVLVCADKQPRDIWLKTPFHYANNLQSVYLCDVVDLTVATLATTAFQATTLVRIELRRCRVTNAMVECIGNTCHMLQGFALHETTLPDDDDPLQVSGLIALARGCPLLQSVTLPPGYHSKSLLVAFSTHCTHLRDLFTPYCRLGMAAMAALHQNCPDITGISALCAGLMLVPSAPVAAVLHRLSRMELIVELKTATRTATVVMATIAQCCTGLQCLSLHFLGLFECAADEQTSFGSALAALARANPHVMYLTIRGLQWPALPALPDADMLTVAHSWPKLRTLEMDGGWLSDAAVVALAVNCPCLTSVLLKSQRSDITDRAVLALTKHCPRLTFVNLSGAVRTTEEAFIQLIRTCPTIFEVTVPATLSEEETDRLHQVSESLATRTHKLWVCRGDV